MKNISKSDYKNFITWAKENTANTVYPCSIAEGFQSGDIYVNDGAVVEAVFFWHYCGFGYISGNPSEEFLEDIYKKIIEPDARRLVLITSDKDVIEFCQNKDVLIDSRAEYSFLKSEMNTSKDSNSFQIERIDENNISKIEGRIIPSFSWESSEQFLKDGFGYVALEQGKVCAVAFSAAVSLDEIDIGVETHEDYRRNGLAALLTNKMCEHIIEIGKKPVWAHAASNTGSMNTALKCGFVLGKTNTVIKRKD